MMKLLNTALFGAGLLFFASCNENKPQPAVANPPPPAGNAEVQTEAAPSRIARGVGYVRGSKQTTLCNKYAGFVTKVRIPTKNYAKAGDVIVEFDDLTARTAIAKAENAVNEQRETVKSKELALRLKEMEPLPSDYRTLDWKLLAAKAKMEKADYDLRVYGQLRKSDNVSELSYREKLQNSRDAQASVASYEHDISVRDKGLNNLYLEIARQDLREARIKLANRERELALAKEELQYYKLVAPYDGFVILHSDTEHNYYPAGNASAEVHRMDHKRVYAYFDERDVPFVVEGKRYRFRSSQYDCDEKGFAVVVPFWVKKTHSSFGDRSLYLVECHVVEEPVDLVINSTGAIEVEIPYEAEFGKGK